MVTMSDPPSARLADRLHRVDDLRVRHLNINLGHPIIGSLEAADRMLPDLGEQPGMLASLKIAVMLDHLLTWARLVFDAQVMPTFAHLSLVRPSLEGSPQVRWLLDPAVSRETRVGRAVGCEIADYRWRKSFEDAMAVGGWTPGPDYVLSQTRIDEFKARAIAAGIAVIPWPKSTPLVRDMALFDPSTDLMAWQYSSGVLHAQAWASGLGDREVIRDGETLSIAKVTANEETVAGLTTGAVRHMDAALEALERYIEPA
jgi:hypothetical protein